MTSKGHTLRRHIPADSVGDNARARVHYSAPQKEGGFMKKNYKSTVNSLALRAMSSGDSQQFRAPAVFDIQQELRYRAFKDNRADNRQFYSPAHNRPALRVLYR